VGDTRERRTVASLLITRDPILRELPDDTMWHHVKLTKEDLGSLRVLKGDCPWEIVSDYTGELARIPPNLPRCRKLTVQRPSQRLLDGRTRQQYFTDLLDKLQRFINQAGAKGHNLTLFLISTSQQGPFTIIEGNHTAVGLYHRYFIDQPTTPYPGHYSYVDVSPSKPTCRWYRS
jgi:hypothetical protein